MRSHQCLAGLALAVAIVSAAPARVLAQAVDRSSPVIGNWRLTAVLDSVDITSMDDKGAQRLVGKVMVIRKDGARFNNYKCHASDFETTRVVSDLYLQKEDGIDNSKLRLPRTVTVVDISCSTIFVKNRNHAVITWDGWFYEAIRVRN